MSPQPAGGSGLWNRIGSYQESDRWRVPAPAALWPAIAARTVGLPAPHRYRRVLRRPVALVFLGMILGAGIAVPVTIRATAPSPAMEQRALEARARAVEAEKAADRAAQRMLSRAPVAPRAPDPAPAPRVGDPE